jgi:hypothetical protein
VIEKTLHPIDRDSLAQHLCGAPLTEVVRMDMGEAQVFRGFLGDTPGGIRRKGLAARCGPGLGVPHKERRRSAISSAFELLAPRR